MDSGLGDFGIATIEWILAHSSHFISGESLFCGCRSIDFSRRYQVQEVSSVRVAPRGYLARGRTRWLRPSKRFGDVGLACMCRVDRYRYRRIK